MAEAAKAEGLMKELQKLRSRSQSFLQNHEPIASSTPTKQDTDSSSRLAFREVVEAVKHTNNAIFELFVRQQSDWKLQTENSQSDWQ
ncbi:hypothetical protein SARC_03150, partial [Sphaeroforma arctica JP610]